MRRACIDIGSNTTRLLVADVVAGEVRAVAQQRAFTHLRRGLDPAGALTPATVSAVEAVVAEQLASARAAGAEAVVVVATAAVRRATNRAALVTRLRDRLGLDVRVLSEAEEGLFAFRGACTALAAREGGVQAGTEMAVVDVGGGSSELVHGAFGADPDACVSLPLGSGVLSDACFTEDPPSRVELAAAERTVAAALAPVDVPRPARAIAVGGSATSLCLMAGDRLDPPAFAQALATLCSGPAVTVADRLGLDPQRVRLLPAGLVILRALQQRLVVALEPVAGGLREGVLLAGAAEDQRDAGAAGGESSTAP